MPNLVDDDLCTKMRASYFEKGFDVTAGNIKIEFMLFMICTLKDGNLCPKYWNQREKELIQ
jgi:hypothetical protein